MLWARDFGAPVPLNSIPGCWSGIRDHDGHEIEVAINGHKTEIDGIPPFNVRLASKKYLAVAMVGPRGGATGGASEDEWIDAFPDWPK